MKQINILKKAAGAISIIMLLLSLAACGNMLEDTNRNTVSESVKTGSEGISINGKIELHGAAPARAASSSFDGTYTWWIMAQNKEMLENSSGYSKVDMMKAYQTTVTNTDSFTLNLPFAGKWTFVIYGFAGSYTSERDLPSTSAAVFICYEEDCAIAKEDADKVITFYPFVHADSLAFNTGDIPITGSINLPLSCNAERVYGVSAKLTDNLNPNSDPIKIPAKPFANGQASLTASNIPSGIYTAKIFFEDNSGNNIYICQEALTVYPGLTTDTWFGTAPYFSIDDEGTHFVVTNDLINSYDSERVINTDYVLYSGNTIYKGSSLTDIGNEEYIQQQEDCTRIKSDFDSEGNVYTLIEKYESNGGSSYGLSLYKNNDTANPLLNTELSTSGFYFKCFCIDRKTDTFYFSRIIREGYGNQSYVLYKCQKDALNSFIDSIDNYDFTISDISDSVINNNKFTVYDDIMYIASGSSLKTIDVSEIPNSIGETPSIPSSKVESYSYTDGTFSTVTDILYQDRAVYVLNQNFEGNAAMNNGGNGITIKCQSYLIKFNILLKTFSSLGQTNAKLETEGKWLYTYRMAGSTIYNYQYFTDAAYTSHVLAKADDIPSAELNLYYPTMDGNKLSTTGFYGPQAFVAIKPKQLVIADNGLAVYTDAYGLFRCKNVNRVVFVDLEDFAISDSKEFSNTICFSKDETSFPISVCSFNWGPENLYDENHEIIYNKTVEYDPNAEEGNPLKAPTVYYQQENSYTHEIEDKSMTLSEGSFGALIVNIPVDTND